MFSRHENWTPKRIHEWGRRRERGRQHFIIWNGVFYRGTVLFMVTAILLFFFETAGNPTVYPPRSGFYIVAIVIAISSYILGYVVGKHIWEVNETLYQRYGQVQERD
jgi:hypothetical protein